MRRCARSARQITVSHGALRFKSRTSYRSAPMTPTQNSPFGMPEICAPRPSTPRASLTWSGKTPASRGGLRDGVAMSRSTDGGLHWTAPVQINAATDTQAFVPIVHVRNDGVIGVTYYDFRNNTSDARTLLTDYWIVTSADAAKWTESHITGPFDLDIAPQDGGLFLGDYQSLGSLGTTFLPLFAKTNSGDLSNQTDIFIAFGEMASQAARTALLHSASTPGAAAPVLNAEWQRLIDDHITRVRRARLRGPAE